MGLMSLATIRAAAWKKLRDTMPGKSVSLQIEGAPGDVENVELFHSPGVLAIPAKGGQVILVDRGRGRVAVAHHDYRVDIDLGGEGGTAIYSTDASGAVKAKAVFGPNGTVTITAPKMVITGGELDVQGSAAPTGSGPFCAIPTCLFSGAPHVGPKVSGT